MSNFKQYGEPTVILFDHFSLLMDKSDYRGIYKLIEAGVDINKQAVNSGKTALMLLLQNGLYDTVREYIKKGADINLQDAYDRSSVMMLANTSLSEAEVIRLIDFMLPYKPNFKATDLNGKTVSDRLKAIEYYNASDIIDRHISIMEMGVLYNTIYSNDKVERIAF